MSSELQRAVSDFSQAEEALRSLLAHVQTLESATTAVNDARTAVHTAGTTLNESQQTLHAIASRIGDLIETLGSVTQQTGAAAVALENIDPERLVTVGEETQAELHKLGTRLFADMQTLHGAAIDAMHDAMAAARDASKEQTDELAQKLASLNTVAAQVSPKIVEIEERCARLEHSTERAKARHALLLAAVLIVLALVAVNTATAFVR